MISISTNQEGEFVFDSKEQDYVLLDLNTLQEQLELGRKNEILDLLQQVMKSNEYQSSTEKVQSQIEWALQTVNEHPSEQYYLFQEDISYELEQQIENQRYPEVHSANKMIDMNIGKIKARVQFMSQQERRNLMKTKSLERSMQQIYTCKQNKFYKEQLQQKYQLMQKEIIDRKRSEIYQQRQKHLQIMQRTKGKLGQMQIMMLLSLQIKVEENKQLKESIQFGLYQTMTELRSDNIKAYRRVKVMEQQQQEKLQLFWQTKQVIAKTNYKRKVEDAYLLNMQAQDRLQQLEQQETQLMHRLRQTEQQYQMSSIKLEKMKSKSYKDLGNMWS
ncbi:unnamed protein product (macronuclear) [Paramecium tetraurelia]|uniref:DUF4201 domain-containing protein n=1 Tax=Paramecium tetraurelia TaxID=5888 RepID=A0BVZ9_PARTE|nr:uncharacterized protein GSPATT00032568001 [Paramecium tetraurelia]CAK62716.1 unnamed protein product [Paramecium tetraurelia]|eukprot:XP_001430114.1 hypothetical protein (macronuclear) [Paramecium tetraurelia strain d4-2]